MELIDIALDAYSTEYKLWGINSTHLGSYIHRAQVIKKEYEVFVNRPEVERDKHDLAHRAAFKKGILALTSTNFPANVQNRVEQDIPWIKLLDSADYIDGFPPEVIAKAYMSAIGELK